MRKHIYLITEHYDDSKIGGIKISDTRLSDAKKNTESPITRYDEDDGIFENAGKQVALGYYDFDSKAEYANNEKLARIVEKKIRSVDRKWAEKAGVEHNAYDEVTE